MATKLTLNIDETIVEAAKAYANKKGASISKLVEDYLRELTYKDEPKPSTKESLMKLRGMIGPVPDNFDPEDARHQYLMEKYK